MATRNDNTVWGGGYGVTEQIVADNFRAFRFYLEKNINTADFMSFYEPYTMGRFAADQHLIMM